MPVPIRAATTLSSLRISADRSISEI